MEEDKNKIIKQKAVAIKYNKNDDIAPKVIAKGKGYVADKILEEGKNKNIPVYKDENLVKELTEIDLGESIPPELYEVVAYVLNFVSDLDKSQEN